MPRVLETSYYCTDRANVVKSRRYTRYVRASISCSLCTSSPKASLSYTRSLAFLLDTPRDLVMSSSPRGVILSSHRVSTRHSRQTSDTNRLFIRSQQESEADVRPVRLYLCFQLSAVLKRLRAGNHPRASKESRRSEDLGIQIEESY